VFRSQDRARQDVERGAYKDVLAAILRTEHRYRDVAARHDIDVLSHPIGRRQT